MALRATRTQVGIEPADQVADDLGLGGGAVDAFLRVGVEVEQLHGAGLVRADQLPFVAVDRRRRAAVLQVVVREVHDELLARPAHAARAAAAPHGGEAAAFDVRRPRRDAREFGQRRQQVARAGAHMRARAGGDTRSAQDERHAHAALEHAALAAAQRRVGIASRRAVVARHDDVGAIGESEFGEAGEQAAEFPVEVVQDRHLPRGLAAQAAQFRRQCLPRIRPRFVVAAAAVVRELQVERHAGGRLRLGEGEAAVGDLRALLGIGLRIAPRPLVAVGAVVFVEAVRRRCGAADVPLAEVRAAVAGAAQDFGDRRRVRRQFGGARRRDQPGRRRRVVGPTATTLAAAAFLAAFADIRHVQLGRADAGQERCPRRRAARRRDVERRQPHALRGQRGEVRRALGRRLGVGPAVVHRHRRARPADAGRLEQDEHEVWRLGARRLRRRRTLRGTGRRQRERDAERQQQGEQAAGRWHGRRTAGYAPRPAAPTPPGRFTAVSCRRCARPPRW
jgi:hypothetical protein